MYEGRRPPRVSPYRVNCETTSAEPPMSSRDKVHLARFIGKNSQICDFLGKIRGRFRIVRPADTQQNQQTCANFSGNPAVNGDDWRR